MEQDLDLLLSTDEKRSNVIHDLKQAEMTLLSFELNLIVKSSTPNY